MNKDYELIFRVQSKSSRLITNSQLITLEFIPHAKHSQKISIQILTQQFHLRS